MEKSEKQIKKEFYREKGRYPYEDKFDAEFMFWLKERIQNHKFKIEELRIDEERIKQKLLKYKN